MELKRTRFYQYHHATKHTVEKLHSNQHSLDWDNQPDPFRRYKGAACIELPRDIISNELDFFGVLKEPPPSLPGDLRFLSSLLFYSLSISAWKQILGTDQRWALRVNPSSGNLHPTECHLIVHHIDGLETGAYHYFVQQHLLEARSRQRFYLGENPPPLVLFLTSIFWREAWKYTDRAYRYCQHDLGHALGAVLLAARAFGWRTEVWAHFPDQKIIDLLGLGSEDEKPALAIALRPQDDSASTIHPSEWSAARPAFQGTPNQLSKEYVPYPSIDAVYAATCITQKDDPPPELMPIAGRPDDNRPCAPEIAPAPWRPPPATLLRIIRKRRSAVDLDGKQRMPVAHLFTLLQVATRGFAADFQSDQLDGHHLIHLYLYVHRVESLRPGLYYYDRVRQTLCPLRQGDHQGIARNISCFQDIAAGGCIALSMVADLGLAYRLYGERGYRYVHYEAGHIGQFLYLGATALGYDATGIGCFQDDEINTYLSLFKGFEVVYNFTLGRAVLDPRLTTLPAYDFPDPIMREAILKGSATPEGTERYRNRQVEAGAPSHAYRLLGKTGCIVSTLGFGCYRIDTQMESHRAAMENALLRGCNLIDTSTNYTDGGSETCVGQVLRLLANSAKLQRDEVIVVSKAGYLQGAALRLAQTREQAGSPFPEMVKVMDGCWHCIHPEFLEDQLHRSLERMRLDKVDVYLLHNPEYFLSHARRTKEGKSLRALRNEFYERIERSFLHLEKEVDRGRIGFYGVSSNTFGSPAGDPEMTSLSRMWEIAHSIKREHHFRMIQLPANLYEAGAMLERNNEKGRTVLEIARELEIAVLVNRPLNAILGHRMVRLALAQVVPAGDSIEEGLQKLSTLENEFRTTIAPDLTITGSGLTPRRLFAWAEQLAEALPRNIDSESWKQIEAQAIRPQIASIVQTLDQQLTDELQSKWQGWRDRYLRQLQTLLDAIRNQAAKRENEEKKELINLLDSVLPDSLHPESLSRKALAVLIHLPGVNCVLNGMRQPSYVDDSLGAMKLEPLTVDSNLFEMFGGQ